MSDIYFNKNAGSPKRPVRKNDGYEDISSYSPDYREDEYEDIDSYSGGRRNAEQKRRRPPEKSGKNPDRRPNGQNRHKGQNHPPRKKRKKKNPFLKAFTAVLLVILIIGGIAAAVAFNFLGKINYNPAENGEYVNPYIDDSALYSSEDVTNILLIGVDAREGETISRSDTMMLISIDRVNEKIKMTSFLRDSYVEIPGSGWNKLNAASSKGGVTLVRNTIEYNFKIKIDHYMLVDFKAFEELIDAIGGVNVKITEKEANYLNRTWKNWSLTGNPLTFAAGESVPLNGEQALMFCRIRKLDSDFFRTERQRRVISAVKDQIMSSPTDLIDVANSVLPLIETDIPQGDMMKLCLGTLFSYVKYDMAQQGIPADGTWHSERKFCGDSLVFDIDKNSEILKDFIYFDVYEGKEEEVSQPER